MHVSQALNVLKDAFVENLNILNTNIIESRSDIKAEIRNEIKNIKSLIFNNSHKIKTLQNSISHLTSENDKLQKSLSNLEQRLSTVEFSNNSGKLTNTLNDNIILEINNRILKLNNLILNGVNEDFTQDNNFIKLAEFFHKLIPDINNLSFLRLGNYDVNKIRPIRITAADRSTLNLILNNAEHLPPDWSLSFDRTWNQRQQFHKLQESIKSYNLQNPNNMKKVIYSKGIPKIISAENSSLSSSFEAHHQPSTALSDQNPDHTVQNHSAKPKRRRGRPKTILSPPSSQPPHQSQQQISNNESNNYRSYHNTWSQNTKLNQNKKFKNNNYNKSHNKNKKSFSQGNLGTVSTNNFTQDNNNLPSCSNNQTQDTIINTTEFSHYSHPSDRVINVLDQKQHDNGTKKRNFNQLSPVNQASKNLETSKRIKPI